MSTAASLVERFLACFEHGRFGDLGALYRDDAVFELFVGDLHEQRKGPDAIVARYVADYDPPPTFLRWDARCAPWGAVVEGDALQDGENGRARFRWVHVLVVDGGQIGADTVYCTGAVPAP